MALNILNQFLRNLKNYFQKDVFKAVSNLQHQLNVDWDKSSPYQTSIFCNTNLLVGGTSFFYKSWLDKGICYIRVLMDSQGNFLVLKHLINQHL